MLERLPVLVDALHLADTGQCLKGQLALSHMPRLAATLHSKEGVVDVDLEFGRDEQRRRYLRAHISAHLIVECQRCLEPMEMYVEAMPFLAIVISQVQAENLPENYEPLLSESQEMPLAAIVEDELILALPVAPKHTDEQCLQGQRHFEQQQLTDKQDVRKKPFALLNQLKNKHKP